MRGCLGVLGISGAGRLRLDLPVMACRFELSGTRATDACFRWLLVGTIWGFALTCFDCRWGCSRASTSS